MNLLLYEVMAYLKLSKRNHDKETNVQEMNFESCTLFHIMPFAKIIGPVEKKYD